MRVFYWSSVLVTAAVLLNACTVGESTPTATNSPSPVAASPPVASPAPASPATTNAASKPAVKVTTDAAKNPLFNKAFVASQSTIAGLINTTDKLQRLDLLSKKVNVTTNRQRDPFVAIPGTLPPLPVSPNQTQPQLPGPAPRVVVKKPVVPPPDPTEAKSINVTGVMEMDNTQYAIVNIPGEPTARYVKVGQRLVNNRVLVKRIDMLGTPTVVFQQFNVEVPRPVGLVAVAPDATGNSSLNPPNPITPTTVTPPTGVILPPPPTAAPPTLQNVPVIVPPAGVPVPNTLTPAPQ